MFPFPLALLLWHMIVETKLYIYRANNCKFLSLIHILWYDYHKFATFSNLVANNGFKHLSFFRPQKYQKPQDKEKTSYITVVKELNHLNSFLGTIGYISIFPSDLEVPPFGCKNPAFHLNTMYSIPKFSRNLQIYYVQLYHIIINLLQ